MANCACLILAATTHTIFLIFSKTKTDKIELSTFFKCYKIEKYISITFKEYFKTWNLTPSTPYPIDDSTHNKMGKLRERIRLLYVHLDHDHNDITPRVIFGRAGVYTSCCLQNCSLRASITYQS